MPVVILVILVVVVAVAVPTHLSTHLQRATSQAARQTLDATWTGKKQPLESRVWARNTAAERENKRDTDRDNKDTPRHTKDTPGVVGGVCRLSGCGFFDVLGSRLPACPALSVRPKTA